MITPEYCQTMTRYNAWQNKSLVTAADGLSPTERWRDRGAFFGSIAATLNHIYWGDALWLSRLAGRDQPIGVPAPQFNEPSDWGAYKRLRRDMDRNLTEWAGALCQTDLAGHVSWRMVDGAAMSARRNLCIAGLFNHQTHHRGQVHCMLTAAGATPEATDLIRLDENSQTFANRLD